MMSSLISYIACLTLLLSIVRCDLLDYSCFTMARREDPTFIGIRLPTDTTIANARVARHHVIRLARIRLFFNAALNYNDDVRRQIIEISLDMLEDAHGYFGTDNRLAFRIPWERMTNNALRIPEAGIDFMDWISDNEAESSVRTLHALWTWMPFNFVVGPGERSDDDTTANIDFPLRHVIGENTFSMLLNLHAAMSLFFHEPRQAQGIPDSFVRFQNQMTSLRQLASRPSYDPHVWEVTRDPNSGQARMSVNGHVKYNVKKPNENNDRSRARRDSVELDRFCVKTLDTFKKYVTRSTEVVVVGGSDNCRYQNYGTVAASTSGFIAGGIAVQAMLPVVPLFGFLIGGIVGMALGLGIGIGVDSAVGC